MEDAIRKIATAITADAAPCTDESGGMVASLTEAVMGMTSGLFRIADALGAIASSVDAQATAIDRVANEIKQSRFVGDEVATELSSVAHAIGDVGEAITNHG